MDTTATFKQWSHHLLRVSLALSLFFVICKQPSLHLSDFQFDDLNEVVNLISEGMT